MTKKEPGKRRFSGIFDIFKKKKKGVESSPTSVVPASGVVEKRPSVRRSASGEREKFGSVSSKTSTVRIGRNGTLKTNKTYRAPPPPNRRPRLPSTTSSDTVTSPPKETNLDAPVASPKVEKKDEKPDEPPVRRSVTPILKKEPELVSAPSTSVSANDDVVSIISQSGILTDQVYQQIFEPLDTKSERKVVIEKMEVKQETIVFPPPPPTPSGPEDVFLNDLQREYLNLKTMFDRFTVLNTAGKNSRETQSLVAKLIAQHTLVQRLCAQSQQEAADGPLFSSRSSKPHRIHDSAIGSADSITADDSFSEDGEDDSANSVASYNEIPVERGRVASCKELFSKPPTYSTPQKPWANKVSTTKTVRNWQMPSSQQQSYRSTSTTVISTSNRVEMPKTNCEEKQKKWSNGGNATRECDAKAQVAATTVLSLKNAWLNDGPVRLGEERVVTVKRLEIVPPPSSTESSAVSSPISKKRDQFIIMNPQLTYVEPTRAPASPKMARISASPSAERRQAVNHTVVRKQEPQTIREVPIVPAPKQTMKVQEHHVYIKPVTVSQPSPNAVRRPMTIEADTKKIHSPTPPRKATCKSEQLSNGNLSWELPKKSSQSNYAWQDIRTPRSGSASSSSSEGFQQQQFKLRKVAPPVEKSGIALGNVIENSPSPRQTPSTPCTPSGPPPPPPPPPPPSASAPMAALRLDPAKLREEMETIKLRTPPAQTEKKKINLDPRDELMAAIRNAGGGRSLKKVGC